MVLMLCFVSITPMNLAIKGVWLAAKWFSPGEHLVNEPLAQTGLWCAHALRNDETASAKLIATMGK